MARTAGSTAENQRQRIDRALDLLQIGFNTRKTKALLVEEFGISERTAERDCRQANDLYQTEAAEIDLPTELKKLYAHQRNQAALALSAGELELSRKWSNDARTTAIQLWRLDPSNPATWSRATTIAIAEPLTPPSERQRRKYRQSIDDLPDDIGF